MVKSRYFTHFLEDFNIKMWLRDDPFGQGLNSNFARRDAFEGVLCHSKYSIIIFVEGNRAGMPQNVVDKNEQMFYSYRNRTFVP